MLAWKRKSDLKNSGGYWRGATLQRNDMNSTSYVLKYISRYIESSNSMQKKSIDSWSLEWDMEILSHSSAIFLDISGIFPSVWHVITKRYNAKLSFALQYSIFIENTTSNGSYKRNCFAGKSTTRFVGRSGRSHGDGHMKRDVSSASSSGKEWSV